jgi:hypothetical protein
VRAAGLYMNAAVPGGGGTHPPTRWQTLAPRSVALPHPPSPLAAACLLARLQRRAPEVAKGGSLLDQLAGGRSWEEVRSDAYARARLQVGPAAALAPRPSLAHDSWLHGPLPGPAHGLAELDAGAAPAQLRPKLASGPSSLESRLLVTEVLQSRPPVARSAYSQLVRPAGGCRWAPGRRALPGPRWTTSSRPGWVAAGSAGSAAAGLWWMVWAAAARPEQ